MRNVLTPFARSPGREHRVAYATLMGQKRILKLFEKSVDRGTSSVRPSIHGATWKRVQIPSEGSDNGRRPVRTFVTSRLKNTGRFCQREAANRGMPGRTRLTISVAISTLSAVAPVLPDARFTTCGDRRP